MICENLPSFYYNFVLPREFIASSLSFVCGNLINKSLNFMKAEMSFQKIIKSDKSCRLENRLRRPKLR